MECRIKIIGGPETGQEFVCAGPETLIGRSPRCAVRLNSGSVSYEHALIAWADNAFYIENLSANGTFLNNQRLSVRTRLRLKDQLRFGPESVARVESLPTTTSASHRRPWLLAACVLLLMLLLAVVVIDPFSGSSSNDGTHAYAALLRYTQDEAGNGQLPPETPTLLREAWRMESAGDRQEATKAWLRLHVLLTDGNADNTLENLSTANPGALAKLVQSDSAPTALSPDQWKAALLQFVTRMEEHRK